ncbi:hypothetical protein M3M35_04360 [Fructilactobacillus myrtifloralis]|uniref:Uncharacterized protein n=1 Tax=Fructilactobacillus myrtifloralis TaxID=2940301 RepID=A0ABY5BQQ1_9LACO|nr:hypothetical protein [Fructilactobacillus myrtifloralis]USS84558.1 hypothetical protein M3M35_04360 [Fructilactobacillus myrtifloralis]
MNPELMFKLQTYLQKWTTIRHQIQRRKWLLLAPALILLILGLGLAIYFNAFSSFFILLLGLFSGLIVGFLSIFNYAFRDVRVLLKLLQGAGNVINDANPQMSQLTTAFPRVQKARKIINIVVAIIVVVIVLLLVFKATPLSWLTFLLGFISGNLFAILTVGITKLNLGNVNPMMFNR